MFPDDWEGSVNSDAAPIPPEGGMAPAQVIDRDSLESSLQEAVAWFVMAFESSSEAVIVTRFNDGVILDVNPQFVRVWGYTPAEAIGQSILSLQLWVDPSESPGLASYLSTESSVHSQEFGFRRKSGKIFVGFCVAQVIALAGQTCVFLRVRDRGPGGSRTDEGCAIAGAMPPQVEPQAPSLQQSSCYSQLLASEAKLKAILNTAAAAITSACVFADRSYTYDYCSAGCEGIFGYSATELLRDPTLWWSRVHPEDRANQVMSSFAAIFAESPVQFEYRFQHRDGDWRWLMASITSQWEESLQGWRVIQLHTDISDRKGVETALRQSEGTNRAIIATIPDLLLQIDHQGHYLQVHRRDGIRLMNPDEGFTGNHIFDGLPEAMAKERMLYVHRALATKRLQVYEYAVPFQDEVRYEEARIMPMEDNTVLLLVRDITDRKVVEASLRRREQEFRTLVENSPDAIFRCDRQHRFLYVNPTVTQLTGISADLYVGKTIEELDFPSEMVKRWQGALEQVFTTGREQVLESGMPSPLGQGIFYLRMVPEGTTGGLVPSVLVVSRDITALKQAQESLLHQSERERSLRLIAQHIRETLDLDDILAAAVMEVQRILQADRALIFRFDNDHSGVVIQESVRPGYPVTLAMRWQDECFPPECYAAYCEGKPRIVPNIALDTWGECLVEFMQQTLVQSKIVAPITQSQQDGSVSLWGVLIVHACAECRTWQPEEAELLQQVSNQLAIAIQQAELYSQVQQLNTSLEQQVQERTSDLRQALEFEMLLKRITDQVRDSLDEDQILETVVQELGRGLQLECCDTGIYNADLTTSTIAHEFIQSLTSARGITFPIAEASHRDIYPFLFQGQTLQFCDRLPCALRPVYQHLTVLASPIIDDQRVLGDMWLYKREPFSRSEIRLVQQVANQCAIALRQSRLYQAAQLQVQELERLNQLKDDFLNTVSHELRTPMSSIKMATHMLEISLNQLGVLDGSPAIKRYFTVLQEEGEREINLINDLLDLTRLDAGTEPLDVTSMELQVYLPHVAESFVERTQQQQQRLLIQIPQELPALTTHLPYLERIVTELLQNACKYTPPGETIILSAGNTSDVFVIDVCNSGVEISSTEYDRIFEKFYRIPNHDPWKHGGTGLGLALVKTMVERLEGSIVVSGSHQPRMTRFTVRLPANRSACCEPLA